MFSHKKQHQKLPKIGLGEKDPVVAEKIAMKLELLMVGNRMYSEAFVSGGGFDMENVWLKSKTNSQEDPPKTKRKYKLLKLSCRGHKVIEVQEAAALGIQFNNLNLRSAIKIGRLFTEKAGLINENLSQIIDKMPIGTVSSVAHLGTSIVATSDDIFSVVNVLEEFGEIRKY